MGSVHLLQKIRQINTKCWNFIPPIASNLKPHINDNLINTNYN